MSQRFFEGTKHATLYAKFRPNAPPQLAQRIVSFLREKYQGDLELCCDVGCGNGQCSALFSDAFRKVLATDISPAQVEVAKTLNHPPNVEFQASPAEKSPAANSTVQVVVACVAAHWFEFPAFFKEVDRILCHKGVVALTSFFLPIIIHPTKSGELNQSVEDLFHKTLGPFWGSGINHLKNEYADIKIPYEETVRDAVWTDEEPCTLADLIAYLETWSGYQNLCREKGDSIGRQVIQDLITRCQNVLEITDEPAKIELKLKRKYFIVMGRKI